MVSFILACLALLIGPALYQVFFKNSQALKGIDGFVFVTIAGLLLIHFFQDFNLKDGWTTFVLLLAGLLGPLLVERIFSSIQREVHFATLLLGAVGFLIHTALDGAALAPHEHGVTIDLSLAAAVVIHRLPVGLTIWWLLKPRFGALFASLGLLFAIGGTTGGFLLASSDLVRSLDYTFSWVQALVSGSILHVVFFRFHLHDGHAHGAHTHGEHCGQPKEKTQKSERATWISAEGFGNLLGLFFLALLFSLFDMESVHTHAGHGGEHQISVVQSFVGYALESGPALAFAYIAGIFIYGFFPERSIEWMKRGGSIQQSAKGMLVGLPLPICSCGVLPYYQTLVKKGAPPAAAVAFLIATPELGIDAVLLSFPLLGLNLTIIRLVASAAIAFVIAWLMSRVLKQKKALPVVVDSGERTAGEKLKRGVRFALFELVDTTAPWMLLGLLLAAIAGPLLEQVDLQLSNSLEVLLFASLGLLVYVCASGATPLVAAMIAAGVSPGAGLAFLLTGPASNVSTFGVFSELHGRRAAILFASLMIGAGVIVGLVTNFLLPEYGGAVSSHLHDHEHDNWYWMQIVSVILIGGLFLSSFIRQGGRQFFGHLLGDQT